MPQGPLVPVLEEDEEEEEEAEVKPAKVLRSRRPGSVGGQAPPNIDELTGGRKSPTEGKKAPASPKKPASKKIPIDEIRKLLLADLPSSFGSGDKKADKPSLSVGGGSPKLTRRSKFSGESPDFSSENKAPAARRSRKISLPAKVNEHFKAAGMGKIPGIEKFLAEEEKKEEEAAADVMTPGRRSASKKAPPQVGQNRQQKSRKISMPAKMNDDFRRARLGASNDDEDDKDMAAIKAAQQKMERTRKISSFGGMLTPISENVSLQGSITASAKKFTAVAPGTHKFTAAGGAGWLSGFTGGHAVKLPDMPTFTRPLPRGAIQSSAGLVARPKDKTRKWSKADLNATAPMCM